MNAQPPPLHSAAPTRNWWERNWKWFLPTLIVTCLACVVAFFLLLFGLINGMMRTSEPYQTAMQRAQTHPQVIAALGQPIEAGTFVQGNIGTQGSSGEADLAIPLSGPRAEATLYITGTQRSGQWRYQLMVVRVQGQALPIDLRLPAEAQQAPLPADDASGPDD